MRGLVRGLLFALAAAVLVPATGSAQSSGITGVVRDTSGAVLPGVTVEASSPALIEKVRTVTTDAQGLYRIVNLRPGSYTVTFTLTGFSTVRREGIELQAQFVANVNADLRVGALEETITVTGASPVVDTQNVIKREVVSKEAIDAMPTSKNWSTKAEFLNPGGSVKDRAALAIIKDAEERGVLRPGGVISAPLATGIGLALVGNARGYRTVIDCRRRKARKKRTCCCCAASTAVGAGGALHQSDELCALFRSSRR